MFVFVSSVIEYNPLIKRNKLLIHMTSWTNFKNIILSERSIYTVIPYDSIYMKFKRKHI